jgi:hypothetical protein
MPYPLEITRSSQGVVFHLRGGALRRHKYSEHELVVAKSMIPLQAAPYVMSFPMFRNLYGQAIAEITRIILKKIQCFQSFNHEVIISLDIPMLCDSLQQFIYKTSHAAHKRHHFLR